MKYFEIQNVILIKLPFYFTWHFSTINPRISFFFLTWNALLIFVHLFCFFRITIIHKSIMYCEHHINNDNDTSNAFSYQNLFTFLPHSTHIYSSLCIFSFCVHFLIRYDSLFIHLTLLANKVQSNKIKNLLTNQPTNQPTKLIN